MKTMNLLTRMFVTPFSQKEAQFLAVYHPPCGALIWVAHYADPCPECKDRSPMVTLWAEQ